MHQRATYVLAGGSTFFNWQKYMCWLFDTPDIRPDAVGCPAMLLPECGSTQADLSEDPDFIAIAVRYADCWYFPVHHWHEAIALLRRHRPHDPKELDALEAWANDYVPLYLMGLVPT